MEECYRIGMQQEDTRQTESQILQNNGETNNVAWE